MLGEGGVNRQSAEHFEGRENTLSATVPADPCHCPRVRTHSTHATRRHPDVSAGLRVAAVCRLNKRPAWCGMLVTGRPCVCGHGDSEKPVFSTPLP